MSKSKSKSIIALLLVFSVLFGLSFNVSAVGMVDTYGPKELVDFDENIALEVTEQYIELGQSLRYARSSKTLTISHYYQNGESWSNDLMKTANLTIGKAGCGVSSLAMMFRYYGVFQNPGQLNTKIGNSACPLAYSGAGAPYLLAVYANKAPTSNTEAENFIIGSISSNRPVLVYMTNGTYTHFVAAYGYSGSTIYIGDSERAWDRDTLGEYTNSGWRVTRVVTYAKTN